MNDHVYTIYVHAYLVNVAEYQISLGCFPMRIQELLVVYHTLTACLPAI